jgi:transcriptional regulator with XRE-family HTH domain
MATSERDKQIGERIKKARKLAGWSLAALGEAIGVQGQQVHKYETGKNRISASNLWAVSEALQVGIEYFFKR